MRDLVTLLVHLIATLARLIGPGGIRSVVTESILVKHQLVVLNRSRKRAPRLRASDRFVAGLCTLVPPTLAPSRATSRRLRSVPHPPRQLRHSLPRSSGVPREYPSRKAHRRRVQPLTSHLTGTVLSVSIRIDRDDLPHLRLARCIPHPASSHRSSNVE